MPPDLQAAAYKKGVIPYLPETPCVDNIEPIITKQGRSMDDQSLVGRGNLKLGIHEDDVRENRISMEIVVDAYNEEERAMGWYCYLDETLHFPFRARCFTKRSISPLVVGEIVQAMKMAPSEECEHEMFVLTRWKNRTVAVPLSQLEGLVFDDETSEAIADWHYWVQRGYEF